MRQNKINSWFISLKKINGEQTEFTLEQLEENCYIALNQFIEAAEQVLKRKALPKSIGTVFHGK